MATSVPIPLPPRESPRTAEAEARLKERLDRRGELIRQEANASQTPEKVRAGLVRDISSLLQSLVRANNDREVFGALREASEAEFDQLLDAFAAATDPRERAVCFAAP